jgi:hypothetical protein
MVRFLGLCMENIRTLGSVLAKQFTILVITVRVYFYSYWLLFYSFNIMNCNSPFMTSIYFPSSFGEHNSILIRYSHLHHDLGSPLVRYPHSHCGLGGLQRPPINLGSFGHYNLF